MCLILFISDAVADCAVASYERLPLAAAQKMLMLESVAELEDFAAAKADWRVDSHAGWVLFTREGGNSLELPSQRLIGECLNYATELEKIV